MKLITEVEEGSVAYNAGIEAGDKLVTINGKKVKDVFDYRYFIQENQLQLDIEKSDKQNQSYLIKKDEYEDLGLTFETGLMDKQKGCANKCIFCFIDQLPKNMRSSLYFKDDDIRLSFLQGNYVTLTNISPEELERIIFYRLSPINISVHATEPSLRKFMLNNSKAGNILDIIQKLYDSNISMNFQIVLCKNVNDGKNLDNTISQLADFMPKAQSLSVVPVGLTKHREQLYPLEPFSKVDAELILNQLETWQSKLMEKHGTRFVYPADEFYLKAEKKIPDIDAYEDFPQIENGVGMLSLMEWEFKRALAKKNKPVSCDKISIATGYAAYDFISDLAKRIMAKYHCEINVYRIRNDFFGEQVTVAGLLCGNDILSQLQGKDLGSRLLIPQAALRFGEHVFLDDVQIIELEEKLKTQITPVCNEGKEFLQTVLNIQ